MNQNQNISKREVLSIIRKIDRDLEGYQRRIKLYCLGGTYLALAGSDRSSKDMDFILSREDFRALSGFVADIEIKDKIRIDLFPDGEMPDFRLPDYETHSRRVLSLGHIDVYNIDLVNFILTKAIAGRFGDYKDIAEVVKDKGSIPKEKLIERFENLKLSKEKEEEIKKKFWAFVDMFYK